MKRAQARPDAGPEPPRDGAREDRRPAPDRDRQTAGSASAAADAINKIAGQMQAFLASDVVYSQRVVPFIKETLDEQRHRRPDRSRRRSFLPSLGWLEPGLRRRAAQRARRRRAAPNGHARAGHARPRPDSVSIGGVTLQPSPAVNRIPAGATRPFNVKFQNQGENDETDVRVLVAITGGGQADQRATKTRQPDARPASPPRRRSRSATRRRSARR